MVDDLGVSELDGVCAIPGLETLPRFFDQLF
jgi:hypothetical protein